MNKHPIEIARASDLRLPRQAMRPAAQRARELAAQTGMAIVISRHGMIEQIAPKAKAVAQHIQAPTAPYGDKP